MNFFERQDVSLATNHSITAQIRIAIRNSNGIYTTAELGYLQEICETSTLAEVRGLRVMILVYFFAVFDASISASR